MQIGGGKATESELRALVAQDSSTLPALEAATYEPESAPNDLNSYDKGSWEHQHRFLRPFALCRTKSTAARIHGVDKSAVDMSK